MNKSIRNKFFLMCIMVLAGVALLAVSWSKSFAAEKSITLRYAGGMPVNHTITQAMQRWAALVKEKTKGRVDIKVFPAGQLYADPDMARIVPGGQIDLVEYSPIALAGIAPVLSTNEMWGLFDDWDHVKRFMGKGGLDLYDAGNKACNAKLLFLMPYGSNSGPMSNKKTVKKLEDWKDLQVRCPGEIYAVALEALGARPVQLASAEVYQALQRGTIDAVVSGASSMYKRKWFEVAKYVTKARYTFTPFYTAASLNTWNKLPKDIQKIMLEASKEVEEGMYGPMLKEEEEAWAGMAASKMEVYTLPASEWARWVEKIRPVWYEWAKKDSLCAKAIELADKTR